MKLARCTAMLFDQGNRTDESWKSANNEAKAQLAKLYFEVKIRLGLDSNAFALLCASTFIFYRSRALFTELTSTEFIRYNFKTGSHGTIHTFKNYFVIVFSIFSNKWYPNRPIVPVWILMIKAVFAFWSSFFFF